jgi:putative glutamine amidotransferase
MALCSLVFYNQGGDYMRRPFIGITIYDGTTDSGLPGAMVQTAYINAIIQAGGTPVLIPNQLDEERLTMLYEFLDGILFTGGGDIRTEIFGGVPHPNVHGVDDARDRLELLLLRRAVDGGKPFLGICRGLQLANVALGGNLYTHIPDQLPNALRHDCYPDVPRNYLAHDVRIEEGCRLAEILIEPVLKVNSLHHQGIKELAPGLRAVAHAPDGIIEAVEVPTHPFGLAVQWHPEWLTDQQFERNLFKSFIEAAAEEKHR